MNPYNSNTILMEWLSAAYHARVMNTYLRHGDRVKICTGADFCGTRWTVNAVMMPVPRGDSFLLPIGSIMRLYKKYGGTHGVEVLSGPDDLDVAAGRREDKIILHVLNTNFLNSVTAGFDLRGAKITGGKVWEIAPAEPRAYVNQSQPDAFAPEEKNLPAGKTAEWTFPARSVSLVELTVGPDNPL